MVAAVALVFALTGDPVVDSYPPAVVADCQEYWQPSLETKARMVQRHASAATMAQIDSGTREAIDACIKVHKIARDNQAVIDAQVKAAFASAAADQRAAHDREQAQMDAARARLRQEKQAEEEQQDSVEQRSSDPAWTRPILTAMLCRATEEKRATLATVAKERRLAKQVGVIDLELMREYQNAIRDDDKEIETAKRELAARKLKPIGCSDATVQEIVDCLPQYLPYQSESSVVEQCRTGTVVEHLRMSRLFY